MGENKLSIPLEIILRDIQKELQQLVGFKPVCELIPAFIFETDPGIRFIQGYVAIKYKDRYFRAYPEKKHDTAFLLAFDQELSHPYLHSFRSLDYDIGDKPRKISKATPVRMDAWLNYLTSENEARQKHISQTAAQIDNFFTQLHHLEKNIVWGDNNKSGKIMLNGLEFSFTVRDNGQIEQNIVLRPLKHDLETFIRMSDNKYTSFLPSDEEPTANSSFWEFALCFIKQLPLPKSETKNLYKLYIQRFNKLYPGISLNEVNDGTIRDFENYMLSVHQKAPETTRKMVNFIRRLVKAAAKKGLIPADPSTSDIQDGFEP